LSAIAVSYSGIASSHRPCVRDTSALAKCGKKLPGEIARALSANSSARATSALGELVIPSITRLTNTADNMLCASLDPGSSSNARSNKLIVSA
jgi:hypothetical protein